MRLAQRGSEGSPALLADLDLSATVVNLERRAFPDTPVPEVLLVLTGLPDLQDNRDSEVLQVTRGPQDTQEQRETRATPEHQDLLLTLVVTALLFKD